MTPPNQKSEMYSLLYTKSYCFYLNVICTCLTLPSLHHSFPSCCLLPLPWPRSANLTSLEDTCTMASLFSSHHTCLSESSSPIAMIYLQFLSCHLPIQTSSMFSNSEPAIFSWGVELFGNFGTDKNFFIIPGWPSNCRMLSILGWCRLVNANTKP